MVMKKSRVMLATLCLAMIPTLSFAQIAGSPGIGFGSSSAGGAGGSGGSATGGTATGGAGGAANNSVGNTTATGGGGGSVGSTDIDGSVKADLDNASASKSNSGSKAEVNINTNVPDKQTIEAVNRVEYSGSYKVKNTPEVSIGGPASGPCNGFSGGVGLSGPGIGIGLNMSKVDEGCSERETARVAAMVGRMDIANAILENNPIVIAAMKAKVERDKVASALNLDAKAQAALFDQQRKSAVAVIERNKTMSKVNDMMYFRNDAVVEGSDGFKTDQQLMAEKAAKEQEAQRLKEDSQVEVKPLTQSLADTNNKLADNGPVSFKVYQ